MKSYLFGIIGLMAVAFIIVQCNKEDNENTGDNPFELIEITKLGCAAEKFFTDTKRIPGDPFPDTVYCITSGDTLIIKAEAGYYCGSEIFDSVVVQQDTIDIYLSDTCTVNCGSWCRCSYVYLIKFSISEVYPQNYRLFFDSFSEGGYELTSGGMIDCAISK